MKKILVFILCTVMLCAFAVSASAETHSDMLTSAGNENSGNSHPEKENATESEISPDTTAPENTESTTETEPPAEETAPEPTVTEYIAEYVKSHIEELCVMASLIVAAIYSKIKDGKFGASLGTLNSNAIKIANKGVEIAESAAEKMDGATSKLMELEEKITSVTEKYEKSEEEKAELSTMLSRVEILLKSVKGAALEASNEVAELLVRANLPNSVKDEIYGRHMKAVHELEAAEEGTADDGKKA